MEKIFKKFKYHIFIISLVLLVFLLVMPFSSRVNVTEGSFYYTEDEVALYILKYKELPPNFITKSEAIYLFNTYYSAMDNGFNIGGDTFTYNGTITTMTMDTSLAECDLYIDRDYQISVFDRGADRLVFTTDGSEVYYTADHYSTFTKVTMVTIQQDSFLWWAAFFIGSAGIVTMYVFAFKKRWVTKEDVLLAGNKIVVFLSGFAFLLSDLLELLIDMFSKKNKEKSHEK